MSAYLIGHITVKNPDKWKTYIDGVQKSLMLFEAEVVCRGKLVTVLAGEHSHENTVVIKFPGQSTLQQWYHSKEYQDLIPIRDEAADVVILSFDA